MDKISKNEIYVYLKYLSKDVDRRLISKKDYDIMNNHDFSYISKLISNLDFMKFGNLSKNYIESLKTENLQLLKHIDKDVYEIILNYTSPDGPSSTKSE